MVLVNLAPASSANFFKPHLANFRALAPHDKRLFCLLASEAGHDMHAIAHLAGVDFDEVKIAMRTPCAPVLAPSDFAATDHV